MCWMLNKKEFDSKPTKYHKIAKEDITVYKFGQIYHGWFVPYYHTCSYAYISNELQDSINLNIDAKNANYFIAEGYHSISEECLCVKRKRPHIDFNLHIDIYPIGTANLESNPIGNFEHFEGDYTLFIGEFTIPKDTEYYENENGEIVSSNIIWTGKSIDTNDIECDSKTLIKLKDLCVGK